MKKLGKRPGVLAFAVLAVFFAMFLIGAFVNIPKDGLELIGAMPAQVGTLLAMLIGYAVKEDRDENE